MRSWLAAVLDAFQHIHIFYLTENIIKTLIHLFFFIGKFKMSSVTIRYQNRVIYELLY